MTTDQQLPPALCLMGPTAAGKTQAALELAGKHGFGVISVDSTQVYRGLDLGSGKPDRATLARVPHLLVDIRDPAESYSAAEFRRDALQAMADLRKAEKIPLLVGGTMLYFKVLRDGIASMPGAKPEIRQAILKLAAQEGWPAVHARLAQVDPHTASRLHPNDAQRLQRALEVYEASGKTLAAHHLEAQQEGAGQSKPPWRLLFAAIEPGSRAILHQRIAERFRRMLAAGLVAEVEGLRARGDLHPALPAVRSVGYRQVWDYLDGRCGYDAMVEKGTAATRQLAKRQLTWLRSWPELHSLDGENENIVENCLKLLAKSPGN